MQNCSFAWCTVMVSGEQISKNFCRSLSDLTIVVTESKFLWMTLPDTEFRYNFTVDYRAELNFYRKNSLWISSWILTSLNFAIMENISDPDIWFSNTSPDRIVTWWPCYLRTLMSIEVHPVSNESFDFQLSGLPSILYGKTLGRFCCC